MTEWKKIEAVLFASGKYLDEETIIDLTNISKKNLKKSLEDLKEHYEKIDTSLKLINEENSWKLNVKEEYSSIVNNVVSDAELAKPVMQTLALVAYKSPVMQSDIINMRGVSAYDHISFLETKKFITKERYGRTYKLKVTEKFKDYFDLDETKIKDAFKDINPKKPQIDLQVYDSVDKFEQNLSDRMKQMEPEKEEDRDDFLNNIDSRIQNVKTNMDKTEEELTDLKDGSNSDEKKDEKEDFITKINKDIDNLTGDEEHEDEDKKTTN